MEKQSVGAGWWRQVTTKVPIAKDDEFDRLSPVQFPKHRPSREDDERRRAIGKLVAPAVDIEASRWSDFRRLCLYYAECVRLDQRSSIHAKSDKENEEIVCLDGRLANSGSLLVRTSEA